MKKLFLVLILLSNIIFAKTIEINNKIINFNLNKTHEKEVEECYKKQKIQKNYSIITQLVCTILLNIKRQTYLLLNNKFKVKKIIINEKKKKIYYKIIINENVNKIKQNKKLIIDDIDNIFSLLYCGMEYNFYNKIFSNGFEIVHLFYDETGTKKLFKIIVDKNYCKIK